MGRKRKYSDEFRLKVVKEYLSGEYGGSVVLSHKYGIDQKDIRKWVHRYELHGLKGLTTPCGIYSGEFKLYVVEYMHQNEMSLNEAAIHFCIPSHSTLAKWERIYYEEGPESLLKERRGRNSMRKNKASKPKETVNKNEDLLAEVQRLRMENEYLKKLNALVLEREKSEQKRK